MTRAVVLVAAGRGERLGLPAKVLLPLSGKPTILYSLEAADRARIDRIILVAGEHTIDAVREIAGAANLSRPVSIVPGGARRQDSVRSGVEQAAGEGATLVAVHDGARPLVTAALFDATLDTAAEHGAAIAAVPVVDTLKRVAGERIEQTVPRDQLWAAQTPQAFQVRSLLDALDTADRAGWTVTDEAMLFEQLGWPVMVVPGSRENQKLTHPEDIALLEALIQARWGGFAP